MLVLGSSLFLVSRVYPSPSASDSPGRAYGCGSRLVHKKSPTPSVSKTCSMELYMCSDSLYCTCEGGHEKCRALLVSRKGGDLSTTVVAPSHFTLCGSGIDTIASTAVSVKVYRRVKTDRMAVFGSGGCAVFSLEPQT